MCETLHVVRQPQVGVLHLALHTVVICPCCRTHTHTHKQVHRDTFRREGTFRCEEDARKKKKGKERKQTEKKGKERKAKERKGKERKQTEKKGKERKGKTEVAPSK